MRTQNKHNASDKIAVHIDELKRTYAAWCEWNDDDSYMEFASAYSDAGVTYLRTRSEQLAQLLVVRLPSLLQGSSAASDYQLADDTHEAIVTLLSQQKFLAEYSENYEADKYLGWYACIHALRYQFQATDDYTNGFRDMLTKWSGRVFPDIIEPSLENVVTYLYGTTCWNLVGPEDTSKLTTYESFKLLRRICIEPTFSVRKDTSLPPVSVDLPANMTP